MVNTEHVCPELQLGNALKFRIKTVAHVDHHTEMWSVNFVLNLRCFSRVIAPELIEKSQKKISGD